MPSDQNFPGVSQAPLTMPPRPTTPEIAFSSGTPVQKAEASDLHARREFERFRQTVPPSELTNTARQFADTPAAKAADKHADSVTNRHAKAQARHDGILAGLTVPGDDAAAQVSAQRWWSRQKPLLDRESSSGLMNAVSRLIDQASATGDLAAACEEIPLYLQARGQPSAYFNDLLATKLSELASARDEVAKTAGARDIVNANRDSLHRSYLRGTLPPPPVSAATYDVDA